MGTVHNKGLREGIVVGNCCEVWRFWGGDERLGRKRRDCSIVMAAFHSLTCFFFFGQQRMCGGVHRPRMGKKYFLPGLGGNLRKKKARYGIWVTGSRYFSLCFF